MVFAGGCASGSLWRMGEGHIKLWVTMFFFAWMGSTASAVFKKLGLTSIDETNVELFEMTRIGFQAYLPEMTRQLGLDAIDRRRPAAAVVCAWFATTKALKNSPYCKEINNENQTDSQSVVAVMAGADCTPLTYSSAALAAERSRRRRSRMVTTRIWWTSISCARTSSIPPKKGVMIIDSRPAARQYDPGHHSRCHQHSRQPVRQDGRQAAGRQGDPAAVLLRRPGMHAEPQLGLQGRETRLHQHQGLSGRYAGVEGQGCSGIGVRRLHQEADGGQSRVMC